jgi:hypothetical protein
VTEAALTPASGAGAPRVYVQIRTRGTAAAAERVPGSVRVGR